MIDTYEEENQRLKQELTALRQMIIRVAPGVMYDGRFDQMIISPITILDVARELLQEMASHHGQLNDSITRWEPGSLR